MENILDTDAPQSFDHHACGAVGKFYHFHQSRDATDFMQVFRFRFGNFRIALQHNANSRSPATMSSISGGLIPFPRAMHKRAWENHNI